MTWLAFSVGFAAIALVAVVIGHRRAGGERLSFVPVVIAGVYLAAHSLLAFVNAR